MAQLAGGTAATSAPLFALTGGNPFFVTEAIAAPGDVVPATVVDAVLARVRRLAGPTQAALELGRDDGRLFEGVLDRRALVTDPPSTAWNRIRHP